jgi:diaminopimelate epimerase
LAGGASSDPMTFIKAGKYHSYGNDFLVVPAEQIRPEEYSGFAGSVCDPHFGIGADGCIYLQSDEEGGFRARIFNRDGSEAGMSGNGIRCAAAFLHDLGLASRRDVEINTPSGRKVYSLLESADYAWTYRSLMGLPRFDSPAIPFDVEPAQDTVEDYPLEVGGQILRITALWVGNPQCAVLTTDLPDTAVFLKTGAALESHPRFPQRTNVSFVKVEARDHIRIVIFERGVGPTHSSGTGSCGAALAALLAGKVTSPVKVTTATGTQVVEWVPGHEIALTGTAHLIARTEFRWKRG